MAVPASKAELLQAMNQHFSKLVAELDTISNPDAQAPGMEGHSKGTVMSVNDLTAYLIGWGELVLKWVDLREAGKEPEFPETGFKWNELGTLAQKFYGDYADADFPTLLVMLKSTHARLVELVERLDDAALYGQAWYEKWPLGRMIQFNTASPYANARVRLRRWKKTLAAN